jgi:hypothetical protein
MSGEAGFGFVASKAELDILELSPFVEADEKLRDVKPQSQDAVFGKLEAVMEGIERHAKATDNEVGGRKILGLFKRAMWRTLKENRDKREEPASEVSVREFMGALRENRVNREEAARQIREAAIRAYTMGAGLDRDSAGYLYTDMNRTLRQITKLTSLKDAAVRGAMRVALEKCGLWAYTDLLMDLIRKLVPSSAEAQTLYRQQEMAPVALERLRSLKNRVIAFTSFTPFTSSEQRTRDFPGNVIWRLQSSRRMKVGDLSEFPDEEECLLAPGSAVQIVRVQPEGPDGRTVVEVRDLPLLKEVKDGPKKLWTGHELLEVPLASELRMEGKEGFGFVASEGALDLLSLSRFIDADEQLRGMRAQSVDTILANVPGVVEGLEAHAKATEARARAREVREKGTAVAKVTRNEEGCEELCKMFREAMDDTKTGPVTKLRTVRDAVIRTYTMSKDPTGYLFRDLNANLRSVAAFASLEEEAVRKVVRAVLESRQLVPYADLLFDAVKKLDSTSAAQRRGIGVRG